MTLIILLFGFSWIITWVRQLLGFGDYRYNRNERKAIKRRRRRDAIHNFVVAYFSDDEYQLIRYIPREIMNALPELVERSNIMTYDTTLAGLHHVMEIALRNRRNNLFTIIPVMEYATRVYLHHEVNHRIPHGPRIYVNLVVSTLFRETTWEPRYRHGRILSFILYKLGY